MGRLSKRDGDGAPAQAQAPAPTGLRATRTAIGRTPIVVFSYPSGPPTTDRLGTLTAAERAVADLLLMGRTQTEIAALRGTSARTVGKQVDSLYRKLGIHSRAELAALCG